MERVHGAIIGAGIETTGYCVHSSRIRAVTVAAEAGLEDSVIQVLGEVVQHGILQIHVNP